LAVDIRIVFGKVLQYLLFVFNSFMKNLSMAKSKDLMSEIFSGQTSRLYSNIGTHLLIIAAK